MNLITLLISAAIGLVVVLFFLVGFVLLKTALYSPPQKKVKPREFPYFDGKSVAERLGLAVQYRTISYDDPQRIDENAFFGLHRLFKTLYPQVHTHLKLETVNNLSLLYTWKGSKSDLQPIMLISHLDVVPADEDDPAWEHPPFSGELADGYVWGRGTLDIKSGVIGILEAVEYLLMQGFEPERTVYLGFGHDEEISGKNGAVAIAALLKERGVTLGCLLDEGGSVYEGLLPGVDALLAMIGISEKGYLSLRLSVTQDGGHSSMPATPTAIGILSQAIARLEAQPMPARLEVVEFLMSYIGSVLPFSQRMAFANTWLFGRRLKKELSRSNLMNASIRTTTAPTIINAGVKDNVLPAKAEAVVNFRLLPGDDLASVYKMVLERINDKRVSVMPFAGEVLAGSSGWDPSPVADVESPYFLRLSRLARETFPGALAAPFLVIGGTDSRHYASVTGNAFRFSPVILDKAGVQSVHAVNERLSFENCAKMVSFYTAYIQEMSTLPGELDAGSIMDDSGDEEIQELIADSMAWEDDEDIPIPSFEETMAFGAEDDDAEPGESGDDFSPEE
ncbi:MAG TPA: M20 family peptidase [Brevefilum sp.]|nr:M20 family peptidase [Brevefilum sp.]HOR20166.1 M20 family peptidase [Brevefilum sp.]HPL70323.1 M20 family peptidase [Brevefilum sp.]